jgi:hypothetical protein
MAVTTRVDNDPVDPESVFMDRIDQLALHVRLEIVQLHLRKIIPEPAQVIFKCILSIYLRFPPAEEVKVWAVDNGDDQFYIRNNGYFGCGLIKNQDLK